jgi:predicted SAM-dependent methyltransferase
MNAFWKTLLLNPLTLWPASHLFRLPGLRRRLLAYQHLRGNGLEIGALHNPLPVPPGTGVVFVDRLPEIDLRAEYRRLDSAQLVPVQTVDDAHTLQRFADQSQDFVIASHIIEHMENPLLALQNWLRVVKPGGVLYLAVPNRDRTFDRHRPLTTFEHLLADLRDGPDASRRAHYEEWMRLVGGKSDAEIGRRIEQVLERQPSIHFHVWDPESFLDLLHRCRFELRLPLTVRHFEVNGDEMLMIGTRPNSA